MMTLPNTALPITTSAGILHLDHYKYLRSLLPQVPHVIQSLVFSDLQNWECQLFVNLLTESDSIKWLADFEEKTSTSWRADTEAAARSSDHGDSDRKNDRGSSRCNWLMIYRCDSEPKKSRECTARLEMKIFAQDSYSGSDMVGCGAGTNNNSCKPGKYPCKVSIRYYHNHVTPENTFLAIDCLKSQDIPAHLKEGFEEYFHQEPVPLILLPAAPMVTAVKSKPTAPVASPRSPPPQNQHNQIIIKEELDFVKPELSLSPMSTDRKLLTRLEGEQSQEFHLDQISQRLNMALDVLRQMLKRPGTSCAAVKLFLDKFDKLKNYPNELEDALASFGGQWDWLVATAETHPTVQEAQPEPVPVPPPALDPLTLVEEERSPVKKRKKKEDEEDPSGDIDNVGLPQMTSGVQQEGPEGKKRKRARCGSCPSCLNRDKTQDCRICRNCLDQKRYGGPGRLKKACVKRQCAVLSQPSTPGDSLKTEPIGFPTAASCQSTVSSSICKNPSAVNGSLLSCGDTSSFSSSGSAISLDCNSTGGTGSSSSSTTTTNLSSASSISSSLASLRPLAIKSEPLTTAQVLASQTPVPVTLSTTQSIALSEALSSGQVISLASCSSISGPTILSWPANQLAPTFQVQVQQPVQFTFQPQMKAISNTLDSCSGSGDKHEEPQLQTLHFTSQQLAPGTVECSGITHDVVIHHDVT